MRGGRCHAGLLFRGDGLGGGEIILGFVVVGGGDGDGIAGIARRVLVELEAAGEGLRGAAGIYRHVFILAPRDVAVVMVVGLVGIVRHRERHLHEA